MPLTGWLGRGKRLQVGISSTCLLAFVLFGYDQGVFGGILQNENWKNQFDHPNDVMTGIIVSSYTLGCIGGCVLNFFLGELLGRRRAILLAMVLISIGAVLQAASFGLVELFFGRVITGLGTGMKSSTVPSYQSELCKPHLRGRLVSAELLFVAVGVVFAYWLDYGLSFVGGSLAWRFPLAFQILFAAIVMILLYDLPESPRWLFKRGEQQKAIDVLCRVFDETEDSEFIQAEKASINTALELESLENSSGFFSILKKDAVKTRRRVILAYAVMIMDQATGINLVVFYVPSALVLNVGMDPKIAQIVSGCVQVVFMLGSLLPTFAMDKMGRRRTMIFGTFGLGFSMMMIAILLSFEGNTKTASAAVAFFFVYMLVFGLTINCAPWVYVPEILPLHARIRGSALAISSEWLWNFVVVMISPVLINRIQWKGYLVFMAIAYAFVPIIYFFYPETSNLSLEEIDYLFLDGGVAANAFVRPARGKGKLTHGDVEIISKEKNEVSRMEK
ncbi:general substrate transporter [Aaosphaeria arxii CBS 175.79]|uniref:General substrate transporter n=1 Tax=Aaosphaeria arxii CBS 175.79 TaxID=1450172 RepID=A0A6A5Y6N3_9PLEO|nr:general substrate transporter [Aaosphaeria arxii CBS 175.79]KAF2021198.1 general substrate transporter [Aaosphaeria arxii CBS 175.79]